MKRRNLATIRKRSFLLFELLISLTLVALCFIPLVRPHLAMAKKRREQLQTISNARIEQLAYCKIKERLFERVHSWEDLKNGAGGDLKDLPVSYYIEKLRSHPIKKGMALAVEITFTDRSAPTTITRTLYVERL